jgi:hypothetical protein
MEDLIFGNLAWMTRNQCKLFWFDSLVESSGSSFELISMGLSKRMIDPFSTVQDPSILLK